MNAVRITQGIDLMSVGFAMLDILLSTCSTELEASNTAHLPQLRLVF